MSDTVRVITTLHEDGYKLYGKHNMQSWCEHFPQDWNISYYAEKHRPEFSERVEVKDFINACPEWLEFYNHIQNCVKRETNQKQINSYRKALRWSFKMFALLHALSTCKERYLVWMDSDVSARKHPSKNWAQNIVGKSCIAGHMQTIKGLPHVETGVLVLDMNHRDIHKVKDWIQLGYPEKQILLETKPWDGIWIAKMFNSAQIDVRKIKIASIGSDKTGWLLHNVGDDKFTKNHSGRSGRISQSELI